MDSAPLISPSSEERFWSRLRDRVDTILAERKPKSSIDRSPAACGVESERGKRLRDDSLLLIRGLDSVASSLSQLTETLSTAQQGLNELVKPSRTKSEKRECQGSEDEDDQPKAKRQCGPGDLPEKDDGAGSDEPDVTDCEQKAGPDKQNVTVCEQKAHPDGLKEDKIISMDVAKSGNLKKAKNLAITMASKAASFARELKMIKSELSFMQERCTLLEEENRRLREGLDNGARPEEDDLVRLQLEALLAEKSRLANENATLTRENQCLHQLVEYHQLTSQDLPSSYDQDVIQGICLDFSSPVGKLDTYLEEENGYGDGEFPSTPSADKLGPGSSHAEEHCKK